MKRFSCGCGLRVFFDDYHCNGCGAELGYVPERPAMLPRRRGEPLFSDDAGADWKPCRNRGDYKACNWLLPASDPHGYCLSCRLNQLVPNLDTPQSLKLWRRVEQAKRRLVYTLVALGLPRESEGGRPPLRFELLEDQRSNPQVAEPLVMTGHRAGIITINLLEADDAARHAVREQMAELYRTLLGHFRHESGHYYEQVLVPGGNAREEYRSLFGDEREDYTAALARYHDNGPAADWAERCITPYASSHPMEDWAETWGHFLHITDALETARANRLLPPEPAASWDGEVSLWVSGAIRLNEIARSLGVDDPYPFVITPVVRAKLAFIHRRLEATRPAAAAAAATP